MTIELNSEDKYNCLAERIAEKLAGSWTFGYNTTVTLDDDELNEFVKCDIHHVEEPDGVDWFIVRMDTEKESSLVIKNNGKLDKCYFLIEVIDKKFYPKSEIEDEYALEDVPTSKFREAKELLPKAIKEIEEIASEIGIEVK